MNPGKIRQYAVGGAISVASFIIGIISSWSTPMFTKILRNETPITLSNVDDQIGWLSYLLSFGYGVGSLLTIFVCERYGRRCTIVTSAVLSVCGAIFATFATNVWMLYIMKTLWGISMAMLTIVDGVYLAEISESDIRGRLCIIPRTMTTVGILAVVGIGDLVSYRAFHYCFLLLLPLVYFAVFFRLPESPYFLLKTGKIDEAREELLKFRKNNPTFDLEFEKMKSHVKVQMENSRPIFELLKMKYHRAVLILYGLKLIQVSLGITRVQASYYDMIQDSNIDITIITMFLIVIGVHVVASFITAVFIDIIGRRKLMLISFVGCWASLGVLAIYYVLRDVVVVHQIILKHFGFITFYGNLIFAFMSSIGIYTMMTLLQAEMFPINVRVIAISFLQIFSLINIPLSQMFRKIDALAGTSGLIGTHVGVAMVGIVVTYFYLPETNGKSLIEIPELLKGNDNSVELINTRADVER